LAVSLLSRRLSDHQESEMPISRETSSWHWTGVCYAVKGSCSCTGEELIHFYRSGRDGEGDSGE
jgi:hypothetical protein